MSAVLRRAAVITAAIAVSFGLTTSAAGAIEQGGPGGGGTMIVTSYYQGNTVVGQRWRGCAYDPNGGSWGTLSGPYEITFTPCQF